MSTNPRVTNLGAWVAARPSDIPRSDIPLPSSGMPSSGISPSGISVVTDCADTAWTVLSRTARASDPVIIGWIYHCGAEYEVTVGGDPIRVARVGSFDAALSVVTGVVMGDVEYGTDVHHALMHRA